MKTHDDIETSHLKALRKYTGELAAVMVALHSDTPVPISCLRAFCSHQHLHNEYLNQDVEHLLIDGKTCVRLSEFVKARELRNKKNRT
jgi:hypothetical protein